jgi:hypothetical protein
VPVQKHGNGDFLVQLDMHGKVSLKGLLESIKIGGEPISSMLLNILTLGGIDMEIEIQPKVRGRPHSAAGCCCLLVWLLGLRSVLTAAYLAGYVLGCGATAGLRGC